MTVLSPKASISKGSKSFYLASLFFPSMVRESCWILYRWCRVCDDRIDLACDSIQAQNEVQTIRRETCKALSGFSEEIEFHEMGKLFQKYRIPQEHALDLINGFEKDVKGAQFQSLEQLEIYAYQVAGVVGLMMSPLMGVRDPNAHHHAMNMGMAMQLTNIARDISEDFHRGRIYLPLNWLEKSGIHPENLLDSGQREKVYQVVLKLLSRSNQLYESGFRGLQYLPFRAAIAVSIAASVYSAIGKKIERLGPQSLDQRIYVTFPEKLFLIFVGFIRVIPSILPRLRRTS